jgi:RNA polymerase primary sigma factor
MENMGDGEKDALKSYFEQIKKTTLLDFDEEKLLSRKIQTGDKEAHRMMVEANLRLVVKIAKTFLTSDVSLMDLIQEGNLGLIKAADKYDYRKNVRFSTYASWWIKQSIVRSLSNKRRAIRLPHRKEEILRKITKTVNTLCQELMHEPSVAEVAGALGIQEEEIASIMNISNTPVSFDGEATKDSGSLQEIFEDYSYNPDRELMRTSLKEETMRFLKCLEEKEREILLHRYSFYGGRKYTLKSIGDKMGMSPETVRQIEIRALKKLGEFAGELKNYVYHN